MTMRQRKDDPKRTFEQRKVSKYTLGKSPNSGSTTQENPPKVTF
jgi:hypothetical protein